MREAWLPHVARRLAACALFAFSVVLYQGCSDAPEDPYAALDAKFPAGRPPLADAQTRAQDADYQKKIQEGGRRYLTLNAAAEKAEHEADRFRTVYREALTKRMKQDPSEAILEAELAKHAHYQGLLKAAEEARAAAEAQRQANMKAIRDRTYADARAYDALRAEADEAARKAERPRRRDPRPPGGGRRPHDAEGPHRGADGADAFRGHGQARGPHQGRRRPRRLNPLPDRTLPTRHTV